LVPLIRTLAPIAPEAGVKEEIVGVATGQLKLVIIDAVLDSFELKVAFTVVERALVLQAKLAGISKLKSRSNPFPIAVLLKVLHTTVVPEGLQVTVLSDLTGSPLHVHEDEGNGNVSMMLFALAEPLSIALIVYFILVPGVAVNVDVEFSAGLPFLTIRSKLTEA
jgi:hypothetical protein